MASDNEREEQGIAPSVQKEQWVRHARTKMARGYALIVNDARRKASFFLKGKGSEPCPYKIALQLIQHGVVIEDGAHVLGTRYLLAPDAAAALPLPSVRPKASYDLDEDASDDDFLEEEALDDDADDADDSDDTDDSVEVL